MEVLGDELLEVDTVVVLVSVRLVLNEVVFVEDFVDDSVEVTLLVMLKVPDDVTDDVFEVVNVKL